MLIFVDCEAYGGAPSTGQLTEFGAVSYPAQLTYHGVIVPSVPSDENPAVPRATSSLSEVGINRNSERVFREFDAWLTQTCGTQQPVFVSDNVAFDWQWINDGFHRHLGRNPFGHSGRRISDFYAGLTRKWSNTQRWKKYRVTKHDHNPVHDALGNVEAFRRILEEHGLEKIG